MPNDSSQAFPFPFLLQLLSNTIYPNFILFANIGWTYQWIFNGKALDSIGKNKFAVTFKDSGNYSVITTNSLGCIDTTNKVNFHFAQSPKPKISLHKDTASVSDMYQSYQWFKNGQEISGAGTSKIKFLLSGDYYVRTIDSNGCVNISDTITFVFSPVFNEIKIYPNPTKNVVKIESYTKVNVNVYDIVGRLLVSKMEATEVNLNAFAEGIYLFYIFDNKGNVLKVEKVHKQN